MKFLIFTVAAFMLAVPTTSGAQNAESPTISPQTDPSPAQSLGAAFVAMNSGDWDGALALAGPAGFVAVDIIDWHRLRAGQGTFQDTISFLHRRGDWPGLPWLRKNSEATIPVDADVTAVANFFAAQAPRTGIGSLRYASALRALGRTKEANAEAIRGWQRFTLKPLEELEYMAAFGDVLKPAHAARLSHMLWTDTLNPARRMLPLVSASDAKIAQARLALKSDTDVDKHLADVPAALKTDGGLQFDRFKWRLNRKRRDDAIALMIQSSTSAGALGRPSAWAADRIRLSRDLMADGNAKQAYELASNHFLDPVTDVQNFAELEWFSGFLALRKLNRPDLAIFHFKRHETAVESPISLGRTHYWQGRAWAALNNHDAAIASYRKGAEHQTAFYGLLSAEKAGVPLDAKLTGAERFTGWQTAPFARSSVFEASLLLLNSKQSRLGVRFLTHLAETQSREDIGRMADMAETIGLPYVQVMLGKRGVKYGKMLERHYYPLHPLAGQTGDIPPELAMAIARRESEFFVDAKSGVGALGLMQLMPRTAREMAGDIGVPFSTTRLVSDADYNAQLGVAYLRELTAQFGSSPVQIAAAYNAGPSRPIRWMKDRGDPRLEGVDVIDWIEQIPFSETRNYVMRVTESLPIYRTRLTGRVEPLNFLAELKGHYVPPPPPLAPVVSIRPIVRPTTDWPAPVPATE